MIDYIIGNDNLLFTIPKDKEKFEIPEEENYWSFLKNSYEDYINYFNKFFKEKDEEIKEKDFTIDCSNGTAAFCKDKIADLMSNNKSLKLSFINTDYQNYKILNEGSGAEFVHKIKKFPSNFNSSIKENLAFDGDVDRIIFFLSLNNEFKMIDGDRQIVINAMIINHFLTLLSPEIKEKFLKEISIGIATTAYANGAIISYIKKEFPNLNLVLGKTGVKFLQVKAFQYDIGIYFEANGHGTIHIAHFILIF